MVLAWFVVVGVMVALVTSSMKSPFRYSSSVNCCRRSGNISGNCLLSAGKATIMDDTYGEEDSMRLMHDGMV